MKRSFLTVLLLLTVTCVFAQTDTVRLRKSNKIVKKIVTDRAPQAVYFQFGGSGPLLSVNYDRRFARKVNGAGFAAGLGYWGVSGIGIFSVPVSLNYLFGRRSSFVEIAGGATFVTATTFDFFDEGDDTESGMIYHINLGYRYQPSNGGFFFRGGVSPLFAKELFFTSYYLGFGHNF